MAVDLDFLLASMEVYHYSAWLDGEDCPGHVTKAWGKWTAGDDHLCLYYTLFAVDDLKNTIHDLSVRFIWGENGFSMMIPTAFRALQALIGGAGADLTMDGLLSTMLTADPAQVEYFVGLVDAYRQSIWNRPFNQEFFAALSRGFEQWE